MTDYCNCTNPEPEEIKRGVIICLACNKDVLDTREQPDDDNEADDFSSASELPLGTEAQYESDRYEAQTGERDVAR